MRVKRPKEMLQRLFKVIQKRTYDLFSYKYSVLLLFLGLITVIVSALQFGEAWLLWSREKYEAVFNSFSDNIKGRSYQNKLCQYVPIDVVYTWVNGSDPLLLENLQHFKEQLQDEQQGPTKECTYRNCVPAHIFVAKDWISEDILGLHLKPQNCDVTSDLVQILHETVGTGLHRQNKTYAVFSSVSDAVKVVENCSSMLELNGHNVSFHHAYWTTDQDAPNSYLYSQAVMLTGVRSSVDANTLKEKLPKQLQTTVDKVFLYAEKSMAVLTFTSDQSSANFVKVAGNMTVEGKEIKVYQVYLVTQLPQLKNSEDFAPNRYEDKEELRYSLRSVEKFAPWVRHIYLVTNGQIPYWLNLDNPRLSIVTHDVIFPNKSHLPTFSSPAIESHLHRIPGLSAKFLYLNDDVLFGREIWPDDFYIHARGQKVYLSWPVPECKEGCPSSWIADGYCDKACNNQDCMWDGGDCDEKEKGQRGAGLDGGVDDDLDFWHGDLDRGSCAPNCINSWLADKYCDSNCNNIPCGFDAGDCGTAGFRSIFSWHLDKNIHNYNLPKGELVAYFNLSSIMTNTTISGGTYGAASVVRIVAISLKFQVLTVVLYPRFNTTTIDLQMVLNRTGVEEEINFTLLVDTNPASSRSKNQDHERSPIPTESTTSSMFRFRGFGSRAVSPKIITQTESLRLLEDMEAKYAQMNVSMSDLPENVQNDLANLQEDFINGLLTQKGLLKMKADVIRKYLKVRHKQVTLRNPRRRKILGFDESYIAHESFKSRHLMDAYADSLLHVNRLYNQAFGFDARKVPAHMPHLIDKYVAAEMQERFIEEWDQTSSHKIRSSADMQYSFSYFYYLMSAKEEVDATEMFDMFDMDNSGTWSDREIRTLLTQLYELPLMYNTVQKFEDIIINCSQELPSEDSTDVSTPLYERYYDSKLPVVSKKLILKCRPVIDLMNSKFRLRPKYKFQIVGEEDVTFVMLRSNLSRVIGQLDEIRKNSKKFICLNDNLDASNVKDNEIIRALLQDFYESFFPITSSFELPPEYRNRFLHMDELSAWMFYRDVIKYSTYTCLAILVIFSLASFFQVECRGLQRRLARRWRRKQRTNEVRKNISPSHV